MPKAVGAYIFAGGFAEGVKRAGFEVIAHLEGNPPYGASTAKLNWPDLPIYAGFENWPLEHLKEIGIDFLYTNPPCFGYGTRVLTEAGPKQIGELVETRSTVKVFSVTSEGRLVLKPIVGWHKNPYTGDLYDVRLANGTVGGRRPGRARATANHRFLTRRGWIPAACLRPEDEVCTGRFSPNAKQRELIAGMMLGDSQIKKHQAQLHVCQTTHEYVTLKRLALNNFVCQHGRESEGTACGEYTRKPRSWFYLKTEPWVKRERQRWYKDNKRIIPDDVELTPLTLAVWYMDDGTVRGGSGVQLCTDRYSAEDVEKLIVKLNALGIVSRRAGKGARSIKYPRILITSKGFHAFIDKIGPYVSPEFRYKLPEWAPPFNPETWVMGEPDVDWDPVLVEKVSRPVTRTPVYCLDVADTHNFATFGGIAHNCAIFSSMGIVTTKGEGSWIDDPRTGCWYDCFKALERISPRVAAIESVTEAYTRGKDLIDELTKRALLLGYSVTHLFISAQWLGIPQRRRRFFIVFHKPARLAGGALNWAPPPTVGEVLSEVADPGHVNPHRPALEEAIRRTPPGQKVRTAWMEMNPDAPLNERGQVKGRPSFQDQRLNADGQLGAYVGDKFFHPTEDRLIGINEAKLLCGFPEDFQLADRPSGWPSLLARGVMPPVARWLGGVVNRTLEYADAAWDERRVSLVDYREPNLPAVDLTGRYLENGRVRVRVGTDGTTRWSARPAAPAPVRAPIRAPVPERAAPVFAPVRVAERPTAPVLAAPVPTATARPSFPHSGPFKGLPEPPLDGEGSGKYVQRLWLAGVNDPDELVRLVHAHFPGRKTQKSDIYYNYRILRDSDSGATVAPWPGREGKAARLVEPPPRPTEPGPAPRSPVAGGRTALLTGSTPSQLASSGTILKILTATTALERGLEELGYRVDKRPVTPGEDLSAYDVVLAGINKPNAIVSAYFYGALWALTQRPDAVLFVDDWQTRQLMPGIECLARDYERAFRLPKLRGQEWPEPVKVALFSELNRLVEIAGSWPWPILAPLFDGGDPALLRLPGRVVPFDPTPLTPRYPYVEAPKERKWVLASLLLKDPPETAWPIERYGSAARGKGGVGRSETNERQPRIREPDLARVYCGAWGVLSPAHDHPGSGWWRVRYLLAADAKSILSAHYDEAKILQSGYYTEASDPLAVEALTDARLADLAKGQADHFYGKATWSKDRLLNTIQELVKARQPAR